MIVTRTWLQEFIDISKISTDDICKTLNSIGLEVDSVSKIAVPKGVVIGRVLEKNNHPDADKLSVCLVDIGKEVVQIVCGAKNVNKDQYVPVAVVGCDLGNDFKIKAAKLRGVDSNGMICSSSELGLPKLNDGILVLDSSIGELSLGKELNTYSAFSDDIIEIELTPNRGDCLSIHGIARELATYYNLSFIEEEKPLTYNEFGIGQVLEVECASNVDASLAFEVANFANFKLCVLHQIRLALIGSFSANHIQDAISYVTHSLGVVLNAYALKEAASKGDLALLHIKKDKNNFDCVYGKELLSTIGVKVEPTATQDDIYIIQASYIEPDLLSRRVYETKIKTGEVYYRSSRGSEPDIKSGINYFTSFVSKYGAQIYAGSEIFVDEKEKITLDICVKKVNAIIGQKTPKSKIEKILSALGFEVKDGVSGGLSIRIPLFRHDIKNIADVTEEIVRIIGIDNIQSKPLAIDEVNRHNNVSNDLIKKNIIRTKAISNGFFETITYVFSSKENLEKYGFETVHEKKDILNPITQELNTYRTTSLLNLVEACSNNFKLGFKKVALFEIGTIFNAQRDEFKKISFVYSGDKELEDFSNHGKPQNINFFEFAQKVLNCVGKFELEPIKNISNGFIHPYQSAVVIMNNKEVGYISKLHPSVAADFDLPDTFVAQIDFDAIENNLHKASSYSKFQASKRDLSIIAPKTLEFKEIKKAIESIENNTIKQFNLVDVYSDEKLGENQSLTIRFVLQSEIKTLEEEDITTTMNQILEKLQSDLSIGLR
ncbi:MAG: phenylalanine--tRNA ligase subunit beta [Arcobacteraceae bacterium]